MRNDQPVRTTRCVIALSLGLCACIGDLEVPAGRHKSCPENEQKLKSAVARWMSTEHHAIRQNVGFVDYAEGNLVEVDDDKIAQAIGKLMFIDDGEAKCPWAHLGWQLNELDTKCANEQVILDFGHQVVSGDCSVALISSSHVLTAAHCLARVSRPGQAREEQVKELRVDFGYTSAAAEKLGFENGWLDYVDEHQVECVEVCAHDKARGVDFAILRLKQKPWFRNPIRLSKQSLTQQTKVKPYFHPLGLPMKTLDNSVQVKKCDGDQFCTAPFDNGETGSGGAILDEGGSLVGVVHGTQNPLEEELVADDTCPLIEVIPYGAHEGQEFTPIQSIARRYCDCCSDDTVDHCIPCIDGTTYCKTLPSCNSGHKSIDFTCNIISP